MQAPIAVVDTNTQTLRLEVAVKTNIGHFTIDTRPSPQGSGQTIDNRVFDPLSAELGIPQKFIGAMKIYRQALVGANPGLPVLSHQLIVQLISGFNGEFTEQAYHSVGNSTPKHHAQAKHLWRTRINSGDNFTYVFAPQALNLSGQD